MKKLRFHLQRGKNYMKWQYRTEDDVAYFPTESFYGVIKGKLYNNRKVAEIIFKGDNKNVCAWISSPGGLSWANEQCLMPAEVDFIYGNYTNIRYNPITLPYWHTLGKQNIDGYDGLIFIFETRLYIETNELLQWLNK